MSEQANTYSGLPAEMRAELLIGHMADTMAGIGTLMDRIRLRPNASFHSRGQLDSILQVQMIIMNKLDDIKDELAELGPCLTQTVADHSAEMAELNQTNDLFGDPDDAEPAETPAG